MNNRDEPQSNQNPKGWRFGRCLCSAVSLPTWYPRPPLSFPTPGKTVPHHPLGDGHQVTVPHHPLGDGHQVTVPYHPPGDRSTAVHAHCGAQKLRQKMK